MTVAIYLMNVAAQVGVVLRAVVHLSSVLVRETVSWMSAHGHMPASVEQKVSIICCLTLCIAWGPLVAKAVTKAANNNIARRV